MVSCQCNFLYCNWSVVMWSKIQEIGKALYGALESGWSSSDSRWQCYCMFGTTAKIVNAVFKFWNILIRVRSNCNFSVRVVHLIRLRIVFSKAALQKRSSMEPMETPLDIRQCHTFPARTARSIPRRVSERQDNQPELQAEGTAFNNPTHDSHTQLHTDNSPVLFLFLNGGQPGNSVYWQQSIAHA